MGATDVTLNTGLTKSGNAITGEGVAGEAIAAGQVLYRDASDSGKLKLADGGATAALAVVVGIALNGAAANQPVRYITQGTLTVPSGLPGVGTLLVLSDTTPGAVMQEADLGTGEYVTYIGTVLTSTTMSVNIHVSGITHA